MFKTSQNAARSAAERGVVSDAKGMKRAGAAVLTVALSAAGVVLADSPAQAQTVAIHISGTGGQGVYVRPGPSTTSGSPLTLIPEGAAPPIDCAVPDGQNINGVTFWMHVTWNGQQGYYASYYDDSHYANMSDLTARYGIPQCGSTTTTPSQPSVNPNYNRSAAVAWALAHAQDTQSASGLCTWFVSNALWAGGMARSSSWTTGTDASRYVQPFVNYAQQYLSGTVTDITPDFRSNAVPAASPGDVIVYDWDGNGTLDHAAFVVDIASGSYPEVSEWGTANASRWHSARASYQKRGWTWSANSKTWLQNVYPNVRAYLVHLNGGHF